jgi:hypothetical protein
MLGRSTTSRVHFNREAKSLTIPGSLTIRDRDDLGGDATVVVGRHADLIGPIERE